MRAETMFKEYRSMKRELSILEFQLGQFKGVNEDDLISAMCFSHREGEHVLTSSISDKTAKTAMNYKRVAEQMNDEWFDFLWKKHEVLSGEIEFFENSISRLTGNLAEIIADMVMKELGWEELMRKYHVSHSMIAKYRKKAIKELNKDYELRDQQIENYILS